MIGDTSHWVVLDNIWEALGGEGRPPGTSRVVDLAHAVTTERNELRAASAATADGDSNSNSNEAEPEPEKKPRGCFELLLPDGRPAGVHGCEACGRIYAQIALAERCCVCTSCSGAGAVPPCSTCAACQVKHLAQQTEDIKRRDSQQWERADKSEHWDCAMVYADRVDQYFDDLASAIEHLEDEGLPIDRIYATSPVRMTMDAESILEHAASDMYESAYDDISEEAHKELQAALDAWLAKHGLTACHEDTTRGFDTSKDVGAS